MTMNSHPHALTTQTMRAYTGLLILTVCIYGCMYSPQALLKTISMALGSGMTETGMLLSVFMLSMTISPLFVGMLLDKTGVKRAIIVSSSILSATSVLIYVSSGFGQLLAVRCLQALFVPVGLTAIMSAISAHFRHMDLGRALAGYIACNLVGSVSARVLGGALAELVGWRMTLCAFSGLTIVAVIILLNSLKDPGHHHGRMHAPKEYLAVFAVPGVPSLLFAEACGIFVFAGMGNLIPFRMAELGQTGSGHVGLMYLGYAVGLFVSIWLNKLIALFRGTVRLLLSASFLYMAALLLLLAPSQLVLFGAIWVLAIAEFVVHALCPGLINKRTAGIFDRGMINALYLSCYYVGGVLGSLMPVFLYSCFGWFGAYAIMQIVLGLSFIVLVRCCRRYPDLFSSMH